MEKTAIAPSLVLFFITLTYGGIVTFLPSYADHKGVENIGLFFTVYALVLLLSRPIIGKLADWYGVRKFLVTGILLIALALLFLSIASSLPIFLLVAVLYGLGFGTVQPILNALVISLSPPETQRGSQCNICRSNGSRHWSGGRSSWLHNSEDGLRTHVRLLCWFCSVSIGYVLCFTSQETDPLE